MNWTKRGDKIGRRIMKRLNTDPLAGMVWKERRIDIVMATSPMGLDIYEEGGGTAETGTFAFSVLKSAFPNKDWPGENAFVKIAGKKYQVSTLAGDRDVAHPFIDYKVTFIP